MSTGKNTTTTKRRNNGTPKKKRRKKTPKSMAPQADKISSLSTTFISAHNLVKFSVYENEAARGFVESHEKAPQQEGIKPCGSDVNLEKDPGAPPPTADAPPVPGSYKPELSSAGTENPKSEPELGLIRSFESMSTNEKTSPSDAQTAPEGESEPHQPESELAYEDVKTSTVADKAVHAKEVASMAAAGTAENGKKTAETANEKITPQKKEEETKMEEEEEKGELSSAGTENPKSEPEPGLIRSFESMSTDEKKSPSDAQTAPKGESEQHQPQSELAYEEEKTSTVADKAVHAKEVASMAAAGTAAGKKTAETANEKITPQKKEEETKMEEEEKGELSSADTENPKSEPAPGLIRSFESMSTDEKKSPSAAQTAPEGESERHEPQSELAYEEEKTSTLVDKEVHAKEVASMTAAGTAENGKKTAETANEKITPQKKEEETKMEEEEEKGELGAEAIQGSKPTDTWVTMKEYLAEKLSPGEEDRALSEVISESIQKKKEEEGDVREETKEKHPAVEPSGEKKSQKGVVGKIKGAVVSVFGGQHSSPAKAREEGVPSSRDEQEKAPRLQESTN